MIEELILTAQGLKKLEDELDYLKSVKRREVAGRIKQALDFGDISENSEYEDAKNEQAFLEGRVITLEKKLRNARVIDDKDVLTNQVSLGSKVKIKDLETGEDLKYSIVSSLEADPSEDRISNESPVGKAILGKTVGAVVDVDVPAGIIQYKILEINK